MQGGPFNFFETITGYVFPDGSPTPFGLFYTNESGIFGVYYPPMTWAQAPIHLYNDDSISPTIFRIKQSGNIDKEYKDLTRLQGSISGALYPAQPDFSTYSFSPSGGITGVAPDNILFNIPWSGGITGCPLDVGIFSTNNYGKMSGCLLDFNSISYNFQAYISGYKTEIIPFNITLHGNLHKKQKDVGNMGFALSSISFTTGIAEIQTNISDFSNYSFIINTISFTRVS